MGNKWDKFKNYSSNNSLFITLFILLVFISNKLSTSIPLLAPKDTKKLEDASQHDKYLLSTIVFYYYIFLFGFVLSVMILNAIIMIVFNDNDNFIKSIMMFFSEFVSDLLPHLISSMIVVIPLHFIIFYLYRYGYIDNRLINFREEINTWMILSSFIIYFSILYSYSLFHPKETETLTSGVVMDALTKKFTEIYLGNEMTFEKFIKEYGNEEEIRNYFKIKIGGSADEIWTDDYLSLDLSSGGGASKVTKGYIPQGTIQTMIQLKKMLDLMMNAKSKDEKITPWMVAKNIGKMMKYVYKKSGGKLDSHLKSMNYTLVLFVTFIILSTFKWIPSKSKSKVNREETKEEKETRMRRENKLNEKNRLIFTLIKVCLVVSVMLT